MKCACDTIDYGDLGMTRQLQEEVKAVLGQWERERRRLELAKMRQAQNKMGYRRILKDADGFGAHVTMMIPPYLYHKMGTYYGYKCWDDADFCRNFLKHYPECRVVSKSQNVTILTPGMPGFAMN